MGLNNSTGKGGHLLTGQGHMVAQMKERKALHGSHNWKHFLNEWRARARWAKITIQVGIESERSVPHESHIRVERLTCATKCYRGCVGTLKVDKCEILVKGSHPQLQFADGPKVRLKELEDVLLCHLHRNIR